MCLLYGTAFVCRDCNGCWFVTLAVALLLLCCSTRGNRIWMEVEGFIDETRCLECNESFYMRIQL